MNYYYLINFISKNYAPNNYGQIYNWTCIINCELWIVQAFGVGEYEDEDDVDIYAVDTMSNYDTVLSGPKSDPNHGWTAPKFQGTKKTNAT